MPTPRLFLSPNTLGSALCVAIFVCATASASSDRDLSLKAGEKRSFNLAGVAQVALDDASVIEVATKGDRITITAKKPGNSKLLVLLKSDQWVTFRVKVAGGDASSSLVEALPDEGETLRLRPGERRLFETPGIAKLPPPSAGVYELKVNGKTLELQGLAPGRGTLAIAFTDGTRFSRPVLVEAVPKARGDLVSVRISGEALVRVPEIESVEVEDDAVAEVHLVSDSALVVRGLSEGETAILIKRTTGAVEHRAVSVWASSPAD